MVDLSRNGRIRYAYQRIVKYYPFATFDDKPHMKDDTVIATINILLPETEYSYRIHDDGTYTTSDGAHHPISDLENELDNRRSEGLQQFAAWAGRLEDWADEFMTTPGENPLEGAAQRFRSLADAAHGMSLPDEPVVF